MRPTRLTTPLVASKFDVRARRFVADGPAEAARRPPSRSATRSPPAPRRCSSASHTTSEVRRHARARSARPDPSPARARRALSFRPRRAPSAIPRSPRHRRAGPDPPGAPPDPTCAARSRPRSTRLPSSFIDAPFVARGAHPLRPAPSRGRESLPARFSRARPPSGRRARTCTHRRARAHAPLRSRSRSVTRARGAATRRLDRSHRGGIAHVHEGRQAHQQTHTPPRPHAHLALDRSRASLSAKPAAPPALLRPKRSSCGPP
jgi:hypothetical protein